MLSTFLATIVLPVQRAVLLGVALSLQRKLFSVKIRVDLLFQRHPRRIEMHLTPEETFSDGKSITGSNLLRQVWFI